VVTGEDVGDRRLAGGGDLVEFGLLVVCAAGTSNSHKMTIKKLETRP